MPSLLRHCCASLAFSSGALCEVPAPRLTTLCLLQVLALEPQQPFELPVSLHDAGAFNLLI